MSVMVLQLEWNPNSTINEAEEIRILDSLASVIDKVLGQTEGVTKIKADQVNYNIWTHGVHQQRMLVVLPKTQLVYRMTPDEGYRWVLMVRDKINDARTKRR